MPEHKTIRIRNKIIYKTWEENRADITMEELAQIFNIPTPTAYRVVRDEKENIALD